MGRDIFVIEKYFRLFFRNAIKELNINSVEAMVLLTMYEFNGSVTEIAIDNIHRFKTTKTQDQIISELQYDKAAMTRTMQSLESKNFVVRQINPDDNRSYLFNMTDSAVQLIPELLRVLQKWSDLLTKDVENIDAAKAATAKMAQNARLYFKGEC